ncbi:hypothetical protein AVEN_238501-1 [Araneus ventricosus]|uniref:Uncharacterized protein n=1 Tax=Araneus ventricosus TaxID=182803 RepID=A0A4Y2NL41_ARAVE|nr:hypothetical protein AVEN_238501-1 [Araneus ventricosus]
MITEEEEIDETEDLNYETEKITSHAEGTAALDVALRYTEQQPDDLPHNVLFLKRVRDNAARKRLSAKKTNNFRFIFTFSYTKYTKRKYCNRQKIRTRGFDESPRFRPP